MNSSATDSWKNLEAVELYNLVEDPHETENVAIKDPKTTEHRMALLERWRSQRGIGAVIEMNGENLDAPLALADPLYEIIRDRGLVIVANTTVGTNGRV